MSTMYSIGAMNQLADALEKAGFTPEEVTKLKQFKELSKLRAVLSGKASIIYSILTIDCDADPFIPEGYKLEEHKKSGRFEFNSSKTSINDLFNRVILNANVLDYLLINQELILEEWKGKALLFRGTVYIHSDGRRCIRCLEWHISGWTWGCIFL